LSYRVTDQLFLWLLTDPADPVVIGTLNLVRSTRGVSLRYADSWIERGFALSEDLRLVAEELLPTRRPGPSTMHARIDGVSVSSSFSTRHRACRCSSTYTSQATIGSVRSVSRRRTRRTGRGARGRCRS